MRPSAKVAGVGATTAARAGEVRNEKNFVHLLPWLENWAKALINEHLESLTNVKLTGCPRIK